MTELSGRLFGYIDVFFALFLFLLFYQFLSVLYTGVAVGLVLMNVSIVVELSTTT